MHEKSKTRKWRELQYFLFISITVFLYFIQISFVPHSYGDTLYSMKQSDFFKKMEFDAEDTSPKLPNWERLFQKELELAVTHPPTHPNGFEQMIQWTRQGKLWHFPINNQQGLIYIYTFLKISL